MASFEPTDKIGGLTEAELVRLSHEKTEEIRKRFAGGRANG